MRADLQVFSKINSLKENILLISDISGTQNNRFALIIKRFFSSKREVARLFKCSSGYISDISTGKKPITFEIIEQVSNHLPIVNIDWLIHGRGAMIWNDTVEAEYEEVKEERVQYLPAGSDEVAAADLPHSTNAKELTAEEVEQMVQRLGARVVELEEWRREMEHWRNGLMGIKTKK